jgi:hypothetical protein
MRTRSENNLTDSYVIHIDPFDDTLQWPNAWLTITYRVEDGGSTSFMFFSDFYGAL